MKSEEQILAAIEEIANEVNELKKSLKSSPAFDQAKASLEKKIDGIGETLQNLISAGSTNKEGIESAIKTLNKLEAVMLEERPETLHRYIEIRNPQKWLWGIGLYFIASFILCFFLTINSINLRKNLAATQPGDFKYRFLKLKNFSFKELDKDIKTTSDLLYRMDRYYEENEEELKNYVIRTEEQIRIAFEAAEIAKRKEAEARAAREEADRLNSLN